jgi:hypothetical protein
MFTYTDSDGLVWLLAGGLNINIPTSHDFDVLCNHMSFPPQGIPKADVKMSPLFRQSVENAAGGASLADVEQLSQFRAPMIPDGRNLS